MHAMQVKHTLKYTETARSLTSLNEQETKLKGLDSIRPRPCCPSRSMNETDIKTFQNDKNRKDQLCNFLQTFTADRFLLRMFIPS